MADTNIRERGTGPSGQTAQPSPQANSQQASGQAERKSASESKEGQKSAQRAVESAQESFKQAGEAARQGVEQAAAAAKDTIQRTGSAARRGVDNMADTLAEENRKAATSLKEAIDVHRDTIQSATEDVKAVAIAASASAEGLLTIESAVVDWAGQNVHFMTRASQQILRSRSLRDVANAQRELAESLLKSWMQGNVAVLRAIGELSERALGPVSARAQPRVPS
jgi:hypothetical protein